MDVDLESLRNIYIIIAAKGISSIETYDGELRMLDNDLDRGVKALYDNTGETIVAFMFQRGSFSEDEAQAWVDTIEQEGVNLTVKTGTARFILSGARLGAATEDLSFDDVEELLREALGEVGVTLDDGAYRWPWLIEVYAGHCIISLGAHYYKVPYTVDDSNIVSFGELEEVSKAWLPVEAPAQTPEIQYPAAVMAGIQGGVRRVLTFTMHDAVGLPAELADDSLIWKEIFHVSETIRPVSGDVLIVQQDMIDGISEAFEGRVFPHVPITASTHCDETGGIVPSYEAVGFVRQVIKIDGKLYGGLDVIDEDTRQKIDDGRIADCSVYVWFDVYDRKEPDKTWPFVLVHLLLTNYPQIDDLEAFGIGPDAIAASVGEGAQYQHYVEANMGEQLTTGTAAALSAADAALLEEYKAFKASGYTVADLLAQAAQVKGKARELEIASVVAALEGSATREDVTVIDGYRHYPAVIKAVEAALLGAQETMGADVKDDGTSTADVLVLAIVNALPAEARMKLDAQPPRADRSAPSVDAGQWSQPGHRTTPLPAEVAEQVSDESLDRLIGDMILETPTD